MTDRTQTDTFSVVKPNAMESSDIGNPYNRVNFQIDLFQKNIFFYGANTTEKWELFIKKDSSFTFELDGEKSVFEFSKATQIKEAGAVRYHSKKIIQSGATDTSLLKKNITITIFEQQNSDSTHYLPFTISIVIADPCKSITYSGGGFYVSNPALHDIWVLDSLNNQKVDPTHFPDGAPRLEFHLDGGKVYGFGGCNELNGRYFIIRNKLDIELNPIKIMKFCIEASPAESEFLSALNKKRFAYALHNGRLTLVQADKTTLVFKKVD